MPVEIGVILSTKRQKRVQTIDPAGLLHSTKSSQDSKGIYAELKRFIGDLYSRIETFLSLNVVD